MADQTTSTTANPWAPQGEGLKYLYGKARNIFDTQFDQPFPGYSPQSLASLGGMQAIASGDNPFLGPATDAVAGTAGGTNAITTGSMFGDLYDQSQGGMYGDVASGAMLGSNPYADAVLSQQMDDISNRVKASYSTAGRYGSGAFNDRMVDSLGDVANQFNLGRYNTDMANMLRAREGQMASGLSAASGMTGVQGQNISNQLSAAGMAPALSEFRYADPTRMAQVGAAYDEMARSEQAYPWQLSQNLQSIFGALPGTAGTASSVQTGQDPNSWLSALGGASAGAGIGSMFGPLGGLAGAGIGALGSWLFS